MVTLLLVNNYHVAGLDYALDAASIEHIREYLELYECNLRDFARLNEVILETEPDKIYHLVAITHVPTSYRDVRSTFDVNLYGTLNVLEVAKSTSRNIKILYVSPVSEYGMVKATQIPISEDIRLMPVDSYDVSRNGADVLANQYHKKLGLHIVRVHPFNHIGPRQSPDYVVSDFAKQIAEMEMAKRAR